MKLTLESGKYIFHCTYDERSVAKGASFRWDNELKKWWTDKFENAAKLSAYASDELRESFKTVLEEKKKTIEESKAIGADAIIPVPDGLDYLPYQKAGIAYAMKRSNVLIADEMGLGKTIQAIGVVNITENVKRVLIVCPASLKLNWKREFTKWSIKKFTIELANGEFPESDVVIINYDILKKHNEAIRKVEWDVLIVDEAHYLKNYKAQRTIEVFGKRGITSEIKANKKVFLTGTPICNKPAEMWTLAHSLAPKTFSNWAAFMQRYANAVRTRYGWDIGGASNLEELQERLRESFMVRRLKSEVLKELPAKRRQIIELPATGELAKAISKEITAYEEQQEKIEELRIAVELAKADSEQEYKEAVRKLAEVSQASFSELSKLRHETALAKVPYVIEHVEECFESGIEKIVLFAHHKDVVQKILNHFKDISVVVTGDVKIEDRQKAVDEFQNNPKVKLFIGNIMAAGVGLTLTASSHVVFAELDWVPGNISQAEDRCHRIGQIMSVLIQHLVLEGSIDAKIVKTLIAKQEIIERALDKTIEVNVNLPEKQEQSEPIITTKEKPVTHTLSYSDVANESIKLNEDQINAIHEGLKILSSFCDGANAVDGMGFNKMDTNFGKQLASIPKLSAKQAVLGRKLVLKYKRQLPEKLIKIVKN